MLHLLHYPREIIAERVVFTPADQARIALCRGPHNRLRFAYQMGFLRLTDRFPTQQPLEILDDLLAFVAHELAIDPAAIQDYAQRQATVSAHQDHIRFHLGFRPFDGQQLAPTGNVRAAISVGATATTFRATLDPAPNHLRGVAVDLSHALGRQLGTRNTLSQGVVEAFDVIRFTGLLRDSFVLGWWNHTLVDLI